ncbi:hypothetical protein D3C80_890610 [compost metagenome]
MGIGAQAFGKLVLDADCRGVAVGRGRGKVLLWLIASGTEAGIHIGPLAPGIGPGKHVCQFVVPRQRTDVITGTVKGGFVAQGAALGNRLAPVAGQGVELLRTVSGDHPGIQHCPRQCRTFVVARHQAETPTLGGALPAQADIRVFTVVDHIRVGRAQHMHAQPQPQFVLAEGTDQGVVRRDDRARYTLFPRGQQQRVAVIFDGCRYHHRRLPICRQDRVRERQDQDCRCNASCSKKRH